MNKLLKDNIEKTSLEDNLFKNTDKKYSAVHNKEPHFIFSAENPKHPQKMKMSHDEVVQTLRDKGYHVDNMQGRYGGLPEKYIIVHNPKKHAVKKLIDLSHALGQDSSIYSDGENHEMHFHHGDKANTHIKGKGSSFFDKESEDYYSTLNGEHFSHNFDWDNQHPSDKSMLKLKNNIQKNENETKVEILNNQSDSFNPDTKLIHYSPHETLNEINPHYHGVRGVSSKAKQGKPEHPMSFYYLEGAKPESIVTTGSKKKYVSKLGNHKIYDIGKDPENIYGKLKEKSLTQQVNPGMVSKEIYHQAIKDAGYDGIHNSSLDKDTMGKVIGMFVPKHIESQHYLHPKDFKEVSSEDHHENEKHQSKAYQAHKDYGINPKFAYELSVNKDKQ